MYLFRQCHIALFFVHLNLSDFIHYWADKSGGQSLHIFVKKVKGKQAHKGKGSNLYGDVPEPLEDAIAIADL